MLISLCGEYISLKQEVIVFLNKCVFFCLIDWLMFYCSYNKHNCRFIIFHAHTLCCHQTVLDTAHNDFLHAVYDIVGCSQVSVKMFARCHFLQHCPLTLKVSEINIPMRMEYKIPGLSDGGCMFLSWSTAWIDGVTLRGFTLFWNQNVQK